MVPRSREPFLESRMTRKRSSPVRRGGIGKVPEQSGNSLVSYSTARPVRERLLQVIPGHQPGVICKLYLMVVPSPRMRASGTAPAVKFGRAVGLKAGAAMIKEHRQSRRWGVDHSRKANRVQSPSGSRNARWRREPPGGNTEEPEADHLRGSAEKADREKLNDERGIKPLPVNRSRDGAGSGQAGPGWVRKRFCILLPEISALRALETMPGREPRTCLTGRNTGSYQRDCCSGEFD